MKAREPEEARYYWSLAEAREREALACKHCPTLKALALRQMADPKLLDRLCITQHEIDLVNAIRELHRAIFADEKLENFVLFDGS